MARGRLAHPRAPVHAGRVDMTRRVVLYRPAMEQARVLAASRRMFIDGQWVEASNGGSYAIPNPAPERPYGPPPDPAGAGSRRAFSAPPPALEGVPLPATAA